MKKIRVIFCLAESSAYAIDYAEQHLFEKEIIGTAFLCVDMVTEEITNLGKSDGLPNCYSELAEVVTNQVIPNGETGQAEYLEIALSSLVRGSVATGERLLMANRYLRLLENNMINPSGDIIWKFPAPANVDFDEEPGVEFMDIYTPPMCYDNFEHGLRKPEFNEEGTELHWFCTAFTLTSILPEGAI